MQLLVIKIEFTSNYKGCFCLLDDMANKSSRTFLLICQVFFENFSFFLIFCKKEKSPIHLYETVFLNLMTLHRDPPLQDRAKRCRGPRKVLRSKLFGERRNKRNNTKGFARKFFLLCSLFGRAGVPALNSSFFIVHYSLRATRTYLCLMPYALCLVNRALLLFALSALSALFFALIFPENIAVAFSDTVCHGGENYHSHKTAHRRCHSSRNLVGNKEHHG